MVKPNIEQCPICHKCFADGYYHCAEMKLYQHMGHGKAHRRERKIMNWDEDDRWPGPPFFW